MRHTRLLLAALVFAQLTGCETGTPQDDGRGASPAVSTAAERKPASPAPAPAATSAPAAPAQEIVLKTPPVGMLECDELAAKYKTCLETRVTGVNRVSLQNSLEFTLKQWHAIQDRGDGAAALLQECQKTKDTLRKLLAPYGCEI